MLNKTYGERTCEWCGLPFTALTANQIYCEATCTRKASNKKIIENYHAAKNRMSQVRKCDECGSKLSKYNDEDICNLCQQGKKELGRIEFLKRLGFDYIDE